MTTLNVRSLTRRWFDQGHGAFERAFPDLAVTVPDRPFYVCPVCLRAFPEQALSAGSLTREHVPPQSVGGRSLVLTCSPCNSTAGHELDVHMRRETDLFDLVDGRLVDRAATLKTESGRLPVRVSGAGNGLLVFGVPAAANPVAKDAVSDDFGRASAPNGWEGFKFTIELGEYSTPRAASSWLRSAYLAFFATFGYRFILRSEMTIVRQQIAEPDAKHVAAFRLIQLKPTQEPTLIRVDEPSEFRSYAMAYGRNTVYLPRYGDHELYSRLANHPDCNVTLSGVVYPWPTRPSFLHDQVIQERAVSP